MPFNKKAKNSTILFITLDSLRWGNFTLVNPDTSESFVNTTEAVLILSYRDITGGTNTLQTATIT